MNTINKLNTGQLIQLYRKKKGLSITDLANKVGISKQSISLYERSLRTPSISNAMKLSLELGIDFEDIKKTLPTFADLPLSDEIDSNPKLAIYTQVNAYIDSEDRDYVLFMIDILLNKNYDITVSKDIVIINSTLEKISDMYISLDKFISICKSYYFMNMSFIENLRLESNK